MEVIHYKKNVNYWRTESARKIGNPPEKGHFQRIFSAGSPPVKRLQVRFCGDKSAGIYWRIKIGRSDLKFAGTDLKSAGIVQIDQYF